jgi:capsular polysaccharide biosynthesis protein
MTYKERFVISDNASVSMRKVYADTLVMMGVPRDRIVELPDTTYRVSDVVYPTPLTIQPWVKSAAVIRVLETLRQHGDRHIGSPEKLFVSRAGSGSRQLLNEEAVLEVLASKGYVFVQPETLSVAQQITIFSCARLVIGTLGAGLSNVAFAPTGVRVLALATQHMCDDFFWDLVSLKGGQYTSLHGRATSPDYGMHSDFVIDMAIFKRVLNAFEVN